MTRSHDGDDTDARAPPPRRDTSNSPRHDAMFNPNLPSPFAPRGEGEIPTSRALTRAPVTPSPVASPHVFVDAAAKAASSRRAATKPPPSKRDLRAKPTRSSRNAPSPARVSAKKKPEKLAVRARDVAKRRKTTAKEAMVGKKATTKKAAAAAA